MFFLIIEFPLQRENFTEKYRTECKKLISSYVLLKEDVYIKIKNLIIKTNEKMVDKNPQLFVGLYSF